MRQESHDFFINLLNTPSPSGYEEKAAAVWRDYVTPFSDDVSTDVMGNTIALVNKSGKRGVMLAGHIDEIGFVIRYISDEGLIHFAGVGGHDSVIPVGQRVWIHTATDKIPGVIGRKPIHLLEDEERKKKPELNDLWIDVGARKKSDLEGIVELGDPVTFQYEYQPLMGDYATARGFDDKMGAFIVAEALRLLAENPPKHAAVFGVATVQEEIGLRGAKTAAYGVSTEAGIAVDVGHASDYPTVDKKKIGELVMGKGPIICRGANNNPTMFRMLVESAKEANIPYQIEVAPGGTGTDANAMQLNKAGMATCLVAVPIRYMHTPCELLNMTDVEHAAQLLAEFCRKITPKTDFIPKV